MRRRQFIKLAAAGLAVTGSGACGLFEAETAPASVFIGKATSYSADLKGLILQALAELRFEKARIANKTVLLKPNLVEPHAGAGHVNTHPAVIRAAAEAFLSLGAKRVVVGEAPGHRRDTHEVLELSGVEEVLREDRLAFVDFNACSLTAVENAGRLTKFPRLLLPDPVLGADMVVSLAKMKTHHWAGVTLSMKNMFGVMPGAVYGWPKNALHHAGIPQSIVDICATVRPGLAIVDGIVGMEGDGPIMGTPKESGVLVVGENLPAVDVTCATIMGANPQKINFLKLASRLGLGPISLAYIYQFGETIDYFQAKYCFADYIPAQKEIRLE